MKLVVNSETGSTELVPYTEQELADIAAIPAPDPKAAIRDQIAEIEARQIRETARMERERALTEAEAVALQQFGLDAVQLYELGGGEAPPTAALTYRRLKDLDNQIKALRDQL